MRPREIEELHGVTYPTLQAWLRARNGVKGISPIVTKTQPGRGITQCKVSAIRHVLAMLDKGVDVAFVASMMRLSQRTIRHWQDDPKYREATFEYDPDFSYDPDDLTDRSVVAHALCREEPNPDERLDMVLAIVGLHREDEPREHRKLFGSKNRKGAE